MQLLQMYSTCLQVIYKINNVPVNCMQICRMTMNTMKQYPQV